LSVRDEFNPHSLGLSFETVSRTLSNCNGHQEVALIVLRDRSSSGKFEVGREQTAYLEAQLIRII